LRKIAPELPGLGMDVFRQQPVSVAACENGFEHFTRLPGAPDVMERVHVPEVAGEKRRLRFAEIVGRTAEAREMFESILASRNAYGILSEDIHPETGELWGNLPQTYSMAGIINTATRLSSSWENAWARG